MRIVDFRSDTVTTPTEEMRKAMHDAKVGDEVFGGDPTTKELQEYAAQKVGKEAALFVPSGTMGNLIAILSHTKRGQEIILEDNSHIYNSEGGGMAYLAGVQARPIKGKRGIMDITDIQNSIRENGEHLPETGLICIENTHNMEGGVVVPIENMREIYNLAKNNNLPVHLDGARVFNSAAYLKCDVKEITKYCDSVMFSFSKGLCAPAGSMLAGDKSFIEKAKRFRKAVGGELRQSGVLAAPCLIALKDMVGRLEEDHINAHNLAAGIKSISGIEVNEHEINTNIVIINVNTRNYTAEDITGLLAECGILAHAITKGKIRFVTHKYVSSDDIEYTIECFKKVFERLS